MTAARQPARKLIESMRAECEQSVDELDVSVALEASGINDIVAVNRYGARNVAELAEVLTNRIPALVHETPEANVAARIPYLRLACRGLLFAVPGVFYLVIARSESSAVGGYVLLASMLAGWGLSQAVAVVAYRVLGRSGKRAAAMTLRRGLIWATGLASIALLVGDFYGATDLVAIAAGQILYVLAATILLFHNADRLLALSLVPGAAMSAAFLTGVGISVSVAMTGVAVTVGVAAASAWYAAHAASQGVGSTDSPRVSDVLASIPFVVNGILTGVTVAYLPLRLLGGYVAPGGQRVDLCIIPLVLSMGFAEIELLRLQAAGRHLMRRCHQVTEYRRGSLALVLRAQGGFLLVLSLVSLAVAGVIAMTSGLTVRDLTLLSAYSTLGVALLAGLVLVSVDRVHVALNGFWMTAAIIALGVLTTRSAGIALTTEGGYLAGCLVLLCCMTALTMRTMRNPLILA